MLKYFARRRGADENPVRYECIDRVLQEPTGKGSVRVASAATLLFMSSVVAMELFAGCRTPRQEKSLVSFLKPFEKAGRLVTPDHGCFRDAGRVLAGLGRDGVGKEHRRQIVNDVLIAVTAVRFGMVVATANGADFSLIDKHVPVRWISPDWEGRGAA